jgi:hypothetical protein
MAIIVIDSKAARGAIDLVQTDTGAHVLVNGKVVAVIDLFLLTPRPEVEFRNELAAACASYERTVVRKVNDSIVRVDPLENDQQVLTIIPIPRMDEPLYELPAREMVVRYSLTAYTDGNHWAFRFLEHATGKEARGVIHGGESNIYAVIRYWDPAKDDWDKSIQFSKVELPRKQFDAFTKGWEYAGCRSDDEIVPFIRAELAK